MAGETKRDKILNAARQHFRAGQHAEARGLCEQLLRANDADADADAHNLLGVIDLSQGRVAEALAQLRAAIASRPDAAEFHNNLGEALRRSGDLPAAVASFRRAIELRPSYPQAWHNLALAHVDLRDAPAAVEAATRATTLDPRYARAFATLGLALEAQQRWDDAHAAYAKALKIKPDARPVRVALAGVLYRQGRFDLAAEAFHALATADPSDAPSRAMLGECLLQLRRFDDAEREFRSALSIAPDNARIAQRLAGVLDTQGRAEESIEGFRALHAREPQHSLPRLLAATRLPVIYDSAEDVLRWRERCLEGLEKLRRDGVRVDIETTLVPPLFYTAYQGLDDLAVQRAYAELLVPPASPPLAPRDHANGRIRVGFISSSFRGHTVARINKGLIAHLSRERFEVIVLSVGQYDADADARFIREHADAFDVVPPNDLPAARKIVADQRLDVLFYTDLGMDDFTYTLAFSRLAPVQAVTWGHPCTSGVPAIDDYVSSELLESDEADAHYTERLVRLKNLSIYYYRPTVDPPPPASLKSFGFADDVHVYACLQMLFKIHPDFDPILDEILQRDPHGVVVLPQGASQHWEQRLRARFARTMPRTHERVRFIPPMQYDDYLRFSGARQVLLAPVHFGAGNTSYEALAFGTPTVTLPTAYMKGRITAGLYRAMGVSDCIASSAQQYAELALKLGTDRDFSRGVRERILAANHVLYENAAGVRDLEEYFTQATGAKTNGRGRTE